MNSKPTDPGGQSAPLSPRQPAEPGQRNPTSDVIAAERLFRGQQEILIAHKADTYRLRITRNGKLILTK